MANLRLTNGKYALVDDEDLALASRCTWSMRNGYVSRCYRVDGGVATEYLQQFVLGGLYWPGLKICFRDLDTLNNQKNNLIVRLPNYMSLITGMRLQRVEAILAAETFLASEMAAPRVQSQNRFGDPIFIAPLTLKVCWALAQRQMDPHKVPRSEILIMAMKVYKNEIAVPDQIAEPVAEPVPETEDHKEKKPRIIRTADELLRVAGVVRTKITNREGMIATLQGEIVTLKDELMRNELAARLIAGDIPTTELEQLIARHAPPLNQEEELRRLREMRELRQSQKPPAPEAPAPAPPKVWKIVDIRHHDKVLAILMKLQKVGAFHKVDIMSIWNCNKVLAYIRFIAQRVPPGNPFMLQDGLTVSPAATPEMAGDVASAICSVPWPPRLSTVVRAREEAQQALKVILNGYGQD